MSTRTLQDLRSCCKFDIVKSFRQWCYRADRMSETMGYDSTRGFPQSVAHYILDITILDMVNYANDAVVFKGGRLHYQGQTKVSINRERNLLRFIFVYLRCTAYLHCSKGCIFRLAKTKSNRFFSIQYVGSISSDIIAR